MWIRLGELTQALPNTALLYVDSCPIEFQLFCLLTFFTMSGMSENLHQHSQTYPPQSKMSKLSPYPLFVKFHQLISNLGCVECQAQAVNIELRKEIFQHFFEWQTSSKTVLGCRRHCIFKDGPTQGTKLETRGKTRVNTKYFSVKLRKCLRIWKWLTQPN